MVDEYDIAVGDRHRVQWATLRRSPDRGDAQGEREGVVLVPLDREEVLTVHVVRGRRDPGETDDMTVLRVGVGGVSCRGPDDFLEQDEVRRVEVDTFAGHQPGRRRAGG